jgi:hypothetical protein
MKAEQINRLSERAMLVRVSGSQWTGRKKDKSITKDVCKVKDAQQDAGSWWTYLVPPSELKPITRARFYCFHVYFRYTLPWLDGGLRILPSAMFLEYSKEMRKAIADHNKAVSEFLKRYPKLVGEARGRLGNLLDGQHLPDVREIRTKFAVNQQLLPMPSVNDFRADVGNEEIEEVKKQITASLTELTEKAMSSLWDELAELVGKIADTMGEPKKVFRDSLIQNLKDFCELVPKMNLVDDNRLEQIRKDTVKRLANLKPDNLRHDKKDRKKAHKDAKDILQKVNDFLK